MNRTPNSNKWEILSHIHAFALVVFLFILTLVTSCKKSNVEIPVVNKWDCRSSENGDSLDLSSLFPHVYILCLEENEDSRVAEIEKVVHTDSTVFVLDSRLARKIFAFRMSDGHFVNNIGSIGHGHNEYSSILDFSVDTVRKYIYALCEKRKVYQYDYSGNLIKITDLNFSAYKMEYTQNKFYFVCHELGRGNLIVLNNRLEEEKEFFINLPAYPTIVLNHPIQKRFDGTISYFRFLDNNIYELDENNNLRILYEIDFGEKALSLDKVREKSTDDAEEMLSDYRGHIKYFTEDMNYAMILFYDHNVPQLSILEKGTGISHTYNYFDVKDSSLGGFYNPIEYSVECGFVEVINNDEIKERLVMNKKYLKGKNPGLYHLNYDN